MNQTTLTPLIELSERIYRALLVLYPADYRQEYGWLMAQVFRDMCRETYRQQGAAGIAWWWCATLFDLALTAYEQRRKARFVMSKSHLVRFTGILLLLGGVFGALASFSQLQPGSHYSYHGIYQLAIYMILPGYALIGIGLFGLIARYGATAGGLARVILAGYGIGALIISIGLVLTQINESLWNIAYAGILLYTASAVAFGLLHLGKPFLPAPRWMPLVIAIPMLLLLLGVGQWSYANQEYLGSFIIMLLMSIGWVILGYNVHFQEKAAVSAPSLGAT